MPPQLRSTPRFWSGATPAISTLGCAASTGWRAHPHAVRALEHCHLSGRTDVWIVHPNRREPDAVSGAHSLRERNLGRKRSLALREYALGLEAVSRAVAGEPLWRVHEAVFAVLALESEPVDPRL